MLIALATLAIAFGDSAVPNREQGTAAAFQTVLNPQSSLLNPQSLILNPLSLTLNPPIRPLIDDVESILAKAAEAYKQKQYAESAHLYLQAIGLGETRGSAYYDAACSTALSGDSAAALDLLDQAIEHGFADGSHMEKDTDLSSLHDSPRWPALVAKAKGKLLTMLPPAIGLEHLARAAAAQKQYAEAGRYYLDACNKGGGQLPWDAYYSALNYIKAGDKDKAFASLDRLVETFPFYWHFGQIKYLEPLHSDPRWPGIVERINRAGQKDLTPEQKVYGLSRFWQEAKDNFAYFDRVPGLDWDAAFKETIPRVLATRSRYEYALVLQRFCALLRDGHTNVWIPPDLDALGNLPIAFSAIGDKVCVTNVSVDLAKDIPLGSEVVEVNGRPTRTYLEEVAYPAICSSTDYIRWDHAAWSLQSGLRGHSIRFRLRTPAATMIDRSFKFPVDDPPVKFVKAEEAAPIVEYRDLGDGLAYVAINTFQDEKVVPQFEALLPKLANCRALIVDVRRNGGGSGTRSMAVAAHMTDKPLQTSSWRTRETKSAYQAWGYFAAQDNGNTDYIPFYTGNAWYKGSPEVVQPATTGLLLMPTAILTDHPTGSAAEDFLIALDKAPHVIRVGRRSYGSTGQPLEFYLGGNIWARVCTKRDTYPDGRDFVGVGVIPTIEVEPGIEDVMAGRDVILSKAIEVLKAKLTPRG